MNAIPTIAVTLRPKVDKQNLHIVRLRVTFQRKSVFKSLGIKVDIKHWAQKAQGFKYVLPADKQSIAKNNMIRQEVERMEQMFFQQAARNPLTWEVVNAIIDNRAPGGSRFSEMGEAYLNTISNAGSRRRWSFCQELIENYAPNLMLTSIDKQWLIHFEDYLRLRYDNVNTRRAPLKYLRAVINFAINRGNDIDYPFGQGKYKLPAEKKTMRNYLSREQIESISRWADQTNHPGCRIAAKWFLLQCYSGLRYSDIETWTNDRVRDNKIYFADVKTGTPHFIPLYPELAKAIADVQQLKPYAYEQYKRLLRTIGIAVGLPFKLTSHIGRHTFAVQYIEHGGSMAVLQSLLGHSDLQTTMVYAKITNRAIEDDVRRVRG